MTRVNRARHKLSFHIYDIIVRLTMYGIRSSQTREVGNDTFQKRPVEGIVLKAGIRNEETRNEKRRNTEIGIPYIRKCLL